MYSHILIGLNESPPAHRALQHAIRLAVRLNATLTVVAVMPAPPLYATFAIASDPVARQILYKDQETAVTELLELARSEAKQYKIEVKTLMTDGPIADAVSEAVKTNDIDLLVLGIDHGHSLLEFLSSDTVHELAETVKCDVLGVH